MRKGQSDTGKIHAISDEHTPGLIDKDRKEKFLVSSDVDPDTISDDLLEIASVSRMVDQEKKGFTKRGVDDNDAVLVIIPCFNEAATIGSVIVKARQYAKEIVVVDDGSSDDTGKIASSLGATVIRHRSNKGKSAAMKTGFKYALGNGFEYVVSLDGDGQHNPDEIPLMIQKLKEKNADILIGSRAGKRTEMPLYRRVGKRVLDYATSLGNGGMVTDSQSGFRVFTKDALSSIVPQLRGNAFSTESEQLMIAAENGFCVDTFPITCKYQSVGSSAMTSTKSPTSHGFSVLGYVLWVVAERRPLLFISVPGFFMVMLGILLGIFTFQLYNKTHMFPISYALITGFLCMVGALGVFIGLLLNTLPLVVRKTLDEKEMDEFEVLQAKKKE